MHLTISSTVINMIVKTNNIHTYVTGFCVFDKRNVQFLIETCMLFIKTSTFNETLDRLVRVTLPCEKVQCPFIFS